MYRIKCQAGVNNSGDKREHKIKGFCCWLVLDTVLAVHPFCEGMQLNFAVSLPGLTGSHY